MRSGRPAPQSSSQTITTLPVGFAGASRPAHVRDSPEGRFTTASIGDMTVLPISRAIRSAATGIRRP
ncbi:MAG: hypothetical protein AB7G88_15865 [Thermomicrobiales bacterium]